MNKTLLGDALLVTQLTPLGGFISMAAWCRLILAVKTARYVELFGLVR